MKEQLTTELIEACKKSIWSFGNGVLYKLCAENFYHTEDEQILAKVWLIGRAYAAAIERRKIKEAINDDFYIDKVVPAFKKSELDSKLEELSQFDKLTEENLGKILETHYYFTKLTAELTGLKKRSFCSKYLHFHLPNLFPIYDSRVVGSLRKLISKTPVRFSQILNSTSIDREYGKFACKSLAVRQDIEKTFDKKLTLREFDNLLIRFANEALINR
ncbi:MAG: hypothetical protein EA412_00265 [Chitinophagaceae bacterium]|nr:MAG: hypothetical protein EA412_00265 [Chitinophagaceae bacterium]